MDLWETWLCLLFDWMTVPIRYEDDYNKFSVNLCSGLRVLQE